ncbi:hypothetical protein BN7_57 [Wickerhamomyces ciferrii]|uniref:Uncharacterized protein n=1 Tax=Wickerhamomyces ciferrii (strain ATCC 14091 / BCRC 22168 / CBS 111 / JCM 3599 / NBRC 0793 / NRRL Y-1031 F-60-10) TaxID=1206466 RepID=K0KGF5_WICCF|nr:uncharacterized protein BN7_57 [Wickerhamomyces ciferrii]CCH40524.1 hypothetical protein BN7_57 [Wickerhamomyces ciferrii]
MFGSICSGRPDTNKYAINIENGLKISHITLFLLPNIDLDPQFAALIFFQLPNQDFKLFGSISSTKPSAIFKLNNSIQTSPQIMDEMDMDTDSPNDPINNITVGISIEPIADAERQLAEAKALSQQQQAIGKQKALTATAFNSSVTPNNPNTTAILANKIVKHAYNYLTGFIDDQGKINIKYFDNWWDKFKTRLQNDPKFLDNEQE